MNFPGTEHDLIHTFCLELESQQNKVVDVMLYTHITIGTVPTLPFLPINKKAWWTRILMMNSSVTTYREHICPHPGQHHPRTIALALTYSSSSSGPDLVGWSILVISPKSGANSRLRRDRKFSLNSGHKFYLSPWRKNRRHLRFRHIPPSGHLKTIGLGFWHVSHVN